MARCGFAWADIQRFTLPQIEAFLAATEGERNVDRRLSLIIARAAQAKPEAFRKLLKEFS